MRSHSIDGQVRLPPRQEDETEPLRQVSHEAGHRLEHEVVGVDQVEVVDDEHGLRPIPGLQVSDQLVDCVRPSGRTVAAAPGAVTTSRRQTVQGSNHTGPELDTVTVGLVQRQPRRRRRGLGHPPGDERRLSRAGGRHNQCQWRVHHLVEEVEQTRATDVVLRPRGTTQLRPMQRRQRRRAQRRSCSGRLCLQPAYSRAPGQRSERSGGGPPLPGNRSRRLVSGAAHRVRRPALRCEGERPYGADCSPSSAAGTPM